MGSLTNQLILDTNILINLEKGNSSLINSIDPRSTLHITAITVFEFALGETFEENQNRLDNYNTISFKKDDGILTAKILKKIKKQGQEIEFRDVMIASICINNKIPLNTENIKHFERLKQFGLKLID